MNAGPPPVESGILETDVRAIVRLLGRVIAQRLDIDGSRKNLMDGLCEIIGADAWLWGKGGEIFFSSTDRLPGEMQAAFLTQFYRVSQPLLSEPSGQDSQTIPVFLPEVNLPVLLPDLGPVMISAKRMEDGGATCIALYRQPGAPAFQQREHHIAKMVLTEVRWLHRETFPEISTVNGLDLRRAAVLKMLCQGKSRKKIAASLGLSLEEVHAYVRDVFGHFKVHSQSELKLRVGELDTPE